MNHYFCSATLGALALLTASITYAQEPCGDDTCPAGYTCELTAYESCSGGCAPSPGPGEPGDCSSFTCETISYESCQRAACETDADCGEGMVCHTLLIDQSPSTPYSCAPGGACEPPAPQAPAEPLELKQCAPRSELPCESNSDCGEGFDCVPSVSCTCAGATPTGPAPALQPTEQEDTGSELPSDPAPPGDLPLPPAADGGAAPPLPPDDCTCGPTGANYCQLQVVPCATDAECPTGWACIAGPSSCWADSEGNSGCEPAQAQCYPSNPAGYPEPPLGTPGPVGTPSSGEGDVGQGPSPTVPQGPTAPGATTVPVDPTSPGATPDPTTPSPGVTPPRGNPEGEPGPKFSLWGCSVDGVRASSGSSPWMWLSLVMGAAFLRRRSARSTRAIGI